MEQQLEEMTCFIPGRNAGNVWAESGGSMRDSLLL